MTLNFLHFHPRLSLYLHIISPVLKDSKSTFIFLKAYLDLNLDISPSGHCVLNNLYGIIGIILSVSFHFWINMSLFTLVYLLLKHQRSKLIKTLTPVQSLLSLFFFLAPQFWKLDLTCFHFFTLHILPWLYSCASGTYSSFRHNVFDCCVSISQIMYHLINPCSQTRLYHWLKLASN